MTAIGGSFQPFAIGGKLAYAYSGKRPVAGRLRKQFQNLKEEYYEYTIPH